MTSLRHSLNLNGGGVISIVGAGGKTALMFRMARELAGGGDRVLTTTTTKIKTWDRGACLLGTATPAKTARDSAVSASSRHGNWTSDAMGS